MQQKKAIRSGNTAELERLEKELAEEKVLRQKQYEAKVEAIEETRLKNKEIVDLKASLKTAYEKIKALEAGEKSGETMVAGYVRIATCPLSGGIEPLPIKVDGVIVPREKDEDGVIYESVPVQKAIAMFTEGSGFKRYLVGPDEVYKIEGDAPVGMYRKKFTFNKHRKVKDKDGYSFIMVEIEESKE